MSGTVPLSKLPLGSAPSGVPTTVVSVQTVNGAPVDVLVPTSWLAAPVVQTVAPASGDNVAVDAAADVLLIEGSGTLAALTLTLPAVAGAATLIIVFVIGVSSLTLGAASGAVAPPVPSSAAEGAFLHAVGISSLWYVG